MKGQVGIYAVLLLWMGPDPVVARDLKTGATPQETGIHVLVGPSARELEPLALVPPKCERGRVCNRLYGLLKRDLDLSGFFKLLDPKSFLAPLDQENMVHTNFEAWFDTGARYIIKGQMQWLRSGRISLELRFYSVAERKALQVRGQSWPNLEKKALDHAVHTFVNGVIQVLTGKPGIFGSRVVASLKTGAWSRSIVAVEFGSGRVKTIVANGQANMFPRWGPGGKVLYTSLAPGIPSLFIGNERLTKDDRQYRGAVFSPDGARIVASVDMGGQSDLVEIDPRTGRLTATLTRTPWDEVSPDFSLDGSLITFVSNRTGTPQVYVMKSDGTEVRRLTMVGSYNTHPRFGPGNRVVFSGMDEFVYDIFVVDLDRRIQRLTQDQGSNKDPDWSVDGRYIVFVSNRDGAWKLWVMTADGRFQMPLTTRSGAFATPDWGR